MPEPMAPPVTVACLGDVMLDVLVEAPAGLVPDDDTPARITFAAGGQAANVAGWVASLGGTARVVGPRSVHGHGLLVSEALAARGVTVHGPLVACPGAVVSIVAAGSRSLASDAGDISWLSRLEPDRWLAGVDWLFVSGYALLRAPAPEAILLLAAMARAQGSRIAVDLASGSMVTAYGAERFRTLWQSLEPSAVFANDAEWAATHPPGTPLASSELGSGGRSVLVLKHGSRGATFVVDGVPDPRPPVPGPVVDATGAGDALTAGFLVGGADLAMSTAARCVARVGAQPEPVPDSSTSDSPGHDA
ncbi:MAG: carbohydrate kinase family protein [Nocardioides sp.]